MRDSLYSFLGLPTILMGIFLWSLSARGESSPVWRELGDVRSLTQAIAIHAGENDDEVAIPYSEIPSVKRIVDEMDAGTVVFASHEDYVFPADSNSPVPLVFFENGNRVIIGMSDGNIRYYRISDHPEGYNRRISWAELGHFLSFLVSPILNLLLIAVIVLMWRPRMK